MRLPLRTTCPRPLSLRCATCCPGAGKKSVAETGIVRRIHFIYERATRKFRADLSLWMRWIAACERFRSSKQLSKVGVCVGAGEGRGGEGRGDTWRGGATQGLGCVTCVLLGEG